MNQDWPRAFTIAAQVRDAGAALVASVRSGEQDLAAAHATADGDELAGRVFAVKVYEAVPGIGKVKARRTMAAIGIDDDATIGGVSAQHRVEVGQRFAELLAADSES